jgi:Zn-dependent protease with chaperone function
MAATARETTAPVAGPRARFGISPWSRIVFLAGAGLLIGCPDVIAIDVRVRPGYTASLSLTFEIDERDGRVEFSAGPNTPARAVLEQALLEAFDGQLELSERRGGSLVTARTRGSFRHGVLGTEGRIHLDALRLVLFRSSVRRFVVSLAYPRGGLNEAAPLELRSEVHGQLFFSNAFTVRRDIALPDLAFRFGFVPADLWRLLPGGLWLVAWVLVGFAARDRYRRRGVEDPYGAWYAQWRFLQRLTAACWLGWLWAVPAAGANELFFFVPTILAPGHAWLAIATVWIVPPTAAVALCSGLSSSVLTGPEGAPASRLSVVLLGAVDAPLFLLGFAELLWVLDQMSRLGAHSGPQRDSLAIIVACMLTPIFLLGMLRAAPARAATTPPEELLDRARRLARRANVKLKQVVFLPPGPWRLLNYHVGPGGRQIYLPPAALGRVSRREVDALVAHQLAQISSGDLREFIVWLTAFWCVAVVVSIWFALVQLIGGSILACAPALAVSFWYLRAAVRRFRLRSFEAAGDGRAADLTGDPEALITALAKLSRFDLLPETDGLERDRPLGGPVLWRRLEALARRADLPPERLREILNGPGSGSVSYELPPLQAVGADDDNRVFSTGWKRQTFRRWNQGTVGILLLTPTLVLVAAQDAGLPAMAAPAVVLLAVVATYLLREVVHTMLRRRAGATLARGAAARLGHLPPHGWLVGLAPGPNPRLYTSFSDWDLGYLTLEGDRLVYRGEQAAFALRRDQIGELDMGPGLPQWLPKPRIYLQWHDDQQGQGQILSLNSWHHGWAGRPRVTTRKLYRRLHEWWKGPPSLATSPTAAALPLPDLQARGLPPRVAGGLTLVRTLLVWTVLACPLTLLGGLTFDLHEGGWAWWLLIAAPLTPLVTRLPYLRYRDRYPDVAGPLGLPVGKSASG